MNNKKAITTYLLIIAFNETGNPPSTFMDEVRTWAPPKNRGQEMGHRQPLGCSCIPDTHRLI